MKTKLNSYITHYTLHITLLFVLLCLILPPTSQAATYYVDIDGVGEDGILGTGDDVISDDANPGTANEPWQTLGRAYTWYSGAGTKVTEGDMVLFKNANYGVFQESSNDVASRHFHRTDWITYKAATGHKPSFTKIYVNNADHYSSPWGQSGESYLQFEGFTIPAGVACVSANYIAIVDCNITANATDYEGVYAPYYAPGADIISFSSSCNDVTVTGNTLNGGFRGINGNGNNYTIQDNIIHGFSEDGIGWADKHILIENNHIYDCNRLRTTIEMHGTKSGNFEIGETVIQTGSGAVGIYHSWQGIYAQIFQTTTTGFTTSGTITGQSSGATLSSITKIDPAHNDGIQIGEADYLEDIVIRNNVIHGITFQGMKLRGNIGVGHNVGLILENNLVYDVGADVTIDGYSDVNIFNNTFIAPSGGQTGRYCDTTIDYMYNNIMQATSFYPNATFTSHGNNIFGDNPSTSTFSLNDTEVISSNLNALFNDAAGNDFTLAAGSTAIDFGNADYGPSMDILGNPRDAYPDAGCYEYAEASGDILGDITGDGEVSINDVQACVSIILFAETDLGMIQRADISGQIVGEPDGLVNIYDLQELVNMVLSS